MSKIGDYNYEQIIKAKDNVIEKQQERIDELEEKIANAGESEEKYYVWQCRFCEYDCIIISKKMWEHGDVPHRCVVNDTSETHELWDRDKTWKKKRKVS